MVLRKNQSGFTLIELLIVIVVIGILATLVITTYSGIQQKTRNTRRETDINAIQSQLEAYFAQQNKYPTLANMQDRNWVSNNLKGFDLGSLQDPSWSTSRGCSNKNGLAIISDTSKAGCYAYAVTNESGTACDNINSDCTKYTLTAKNEGSGTYVKTSLN